MKEGKKKRSCEMGGKKGRLLDEGEDDCRLDALAQQWEAVLRHAVAQLHVALACAHRRGLLPWLLLRWFLLLLLLFLLFLDALLLLLLLLDLLCCGGGEKVLERGCARRRRL